MTIKTLTIFGTRPEAIKMAPLVKELKHQGIKNQVCMTGQHQQMVAPILNLFNIQPDFNLNVMTANQALTDLTASLLTHLDPILEMQKPDLVFVHGDTTTTIAAALAAYYRRIPVAHIEAGLRTGNIYSPWPEEANRKLTGAISLLHFAPTLHAKLNLLKEGVQAEKIYVTGNTVIDALLDMKGRIQDDAALEASLREEFSFLCPSRGLILVTGHRRENFGARLREICEAIRQIAQRFPHVDVVYPVHMNPNIFQPVHQCLGNIPNVYLIPPVNYLPFIYLMQRATLILTDSGGIQEEAPSLGKQVLVMRETTERPEAIEAGTVRLVGSKAQSIVDHVEELLLAQAPESFPQNPYGDGQAAKRIVQIILQKDCLAAASTQPTKISHLDEIVS